LFIIIHVFSGVMFYPRLFLQTNSIVASSWHSELDRTSVVSAADQEGVIPRF